MTTTNTEIVTVLIGAGAIAREHITALQSMPNVTLAAICDLSPTRARAISERYEIAKSYTDYLEMLDDIPADWAHITTPPSSHYGISAQCLEKGLNVLCEKPIVPSREEFSELREIAEKNQVFLLENQNLRFHSSVRKISRLIETGELGEIVDVQVHLAQNLEGSGSPYLDKHVPHFGLGLPGGVIGDFLPHMAYLATMFAGAPSSVRTIWKNVNADSPLPYHEFRAQIQCQTAPATVAFSCSAQPAGFWLRVFGTKLFVEANLFEPPRLQVRKHRTQPAPLPSLLNGLSEAVSVSASTLASVWRKLGGRSQYDGLAELIDACYRSQQKGQPQPVSLNDIAENINLVKAFTDPELMQ